MPTIVRETKDLVRDERGNVATVARFGSLDGARRALATLAGCSNCTDCEYCVDCRDCFRCSNCVGCSGCAECSHCASCSMCNQCRACRNCLYCRECEGCAGVRSVFRSLVVGQVRSDGYQFVMSESGSVHAGCRVFLGVAQAHEHWRRTRGGTPLGDETAGILDDLERRGVEERARRSAGRAPNPPRDRAAGSVDEVGEVSALVTAIGYERVSDEEPAPRSARYGAPSLEVNARGIPCLHVDGREVHGQVRATTESNPDGWELVVRFAGRHVRLGPEVPDPRPSEERAT